MKKLLLFGLLLIIGFSSFGQSWPKLYFESATATTDIHGGPISKSDTVDVKIHYSPNGNTDVRSIYFDFQHQRTAFELINVIVATPGGQGSAIPAGGSSSSTWYGYPYYSWLASSQNTTSNGNTNYNYSNYNWNQNSNSQITRVMCNIASSTALVDGTYLTLRFKMLDTQAGYSYDPLVMNFAAAWTNTGAWGGTDMSQQKSSQFVIDATANSLITAVLELNGNLDGTHRPKMLVVDTDSQKSFVYTIGADGKVNINQADLKVNTNYALQVIVPSDSISSIESNAITVSDYTATEKEFVSQNIDGTFKNQNLTTGIGYLASDVNYNKKFDGGDITKLFAAAVGVSAITDLPEKVTIGTTNYVACPTMDDATYNNLTTDNWKDVYTNNKSKAWIKTSSINQNINLKYLLTGDVNRSHSSQVIRNGSIVTLASVSLYNNLLTNKSATLKGGFINTIKNITPIDVNLNNVTVTSNNIEIPFNVVATGTNVAGLQFEVTYDASKLKFDEIKTQLPNTWFVFIYPNIGKIKFGAVDKELKSPITNTITPFTLKFSTLQSGLDIASQIKVTQSMDASDDNGNQLGINLNTTTIKLTGYNNF